MTADSLKIQPSNNYVLIEPLEGEKTTPSGIVLPDSVEKKPQLGKVIAVGKSSEKPQSLPCQKNETIVYRKWGGEDFEYQGRKYIFVKFEDVLGVLNK